jgi:hypothetical protein
LWYYLRKNKITRKKNYAVSGASDKNAITTTITSKLNGNNQDNRIVYIDESGVDHQCFRRFAWGKRGQRVYGEASGQVYKRTTLIAGLSGGEILAPLAFDGYTNTKVFLTWIEDCLIPELKPGDVAVMDNASFHKSPKIRALIEAAGCSLVYLSPYSPDLNPIEKNWAL